MRFYNLREWILSKISIKRRLQIVCLWYILSLMTETRKHSLSFASVLSGINKSQFCIFLKHNGIAAYTLDNLSAKQAEIYSKILKKIDNLPWSVAMLIDSTLQKRSVLHSENVQKFNHGKGFVIGHQWTNIVLIINGILIPLPPIAFYSKKYCRKNGLKYKTEHERVVEFLKNLNMDQYIGCHNSKDTVVIADSGYDDKTIERAVTKKGWNFIIALKSGRSVKSDATYEKTPKSCGWERVANFFKNQRKPGWETVRIFTDGPKRKRKEFRIRHTGAFLKDVGKIRPVCPEVKKGRPDGRRKYIACTDLKATPRQTVIGYRLRRKIEIFHKNIKMHPGFEDVATMKFCSVETHVYLVYCAYILLHANPPGISENAKTIPEKQQHINIFLDNKEIAGILHELSKIHGVETYKTKLKSVLTGA